jgi:hypothetical protein
MEYKELKKELTRLKKLAKKSELTTDGLTLIKEVEYILEQGKAIYNIALNFKEMRELFNPVRKRFATLISGKSRKEGESIAFQFMEELSVSISEEMLREGIRVHKKGIITQKID